MECQRLAHEVGGDHHLVAGMDEQLGKLLDHQLGAGDLLELVGAQQDSHRVVTLSDLLPFRPTTQTGTQCTQSRDIGPQCTRSLCTKAGLFTVAIALERFRQLP